MTNIYGRYPGFFPLTKDQLRYYSRRTEQLKTVTTVNDSGHGQSAGDLRFEMNNVGGANSSSP